MNQKRVKRKLSAILSADAVGYSRLMGDDKSTTVKTLETYTGICISRTAYDQVKKKLNYEYEHLGEFEVKNIDEPVSVYKVLMVSKTSDIVVKEK